MADDEEPAIRLLIVDDHEVVALGLRSLIEDEPGITVVGIVGSAAEAVTSARRLKPDVALVDFRLPDGTGADATRLIGQLDPAPQVVMITSVADRRVLALALEAGCCGFCRRTPIVPTWWPLSGRRPTTTPTSPATCSNT
ncbi:MAG: response regulator transcription factor [Acidimicrobiia bacterium]|nr:response regulator transcription factor [Acidimicrobiia bacterium]MDH5519675.1 response regulator transcription factor [Acidimicrobiia bacterium]